MFAPSGKALSVLSAPGSGGGTEVGAAGGVAAAVVGGWVRREHAAVRRLRADSHFTLGVGHLNTSLWRVERRGEEVRFECERVPILCDLLVWSGLNQSEPVWSGLVFSGLA